MLRSDEDAEGHGAKPVIPRAVLDAGGESGSLLIQAITRRIQEMAPGQVLHIISREPSTRLDIPTWCRQNSHVLLQQQENGDETWFWIRKSAGS